MNPRRMLAAATTLLALFVASTASVQAAPVTKQVTIQAIQVCDDDGSNCASATTYESFADKMWEQAGIDFYFLPTLIWNSSFANAYDFDTDDGSLLTTGTAAFAPAANVLNMFFVNDLQLSLSPGSTLYGFGCGAPIYAGACFNQSGVVINSTAVDTYSAVGRIDTVAHEVGHVLGLGHDTFGAGGGDNLMTSGSARTVPQLLGDINPSGLLLSKLTAAQVTEALRSPYVTDIRAVPEPGSLVLVGLALSGLAFSRRRRTLAA